MKYSNAVEPATLRSVIHKGGNKTTNHLSAKLYTKDREKNMTVVSWMCTMTDSSVQPFL